MNKNNQTIQTTKLGNKIQKKKATPQENKAEPEGYLLDAGEEPVGHKETVRFFFGLIVLIAALLMLLSFTSYLFTGGDDQSLIEQGSMEGFMNYAGAIGAYCANFWMNSCFGFSAFLVPLFLIVAAMKLTRAYKVRLWKWCLNCSILIIWISVAAAFCLQQTFENSEGWGFINPGGGHGMFISHWLSQRIGTIGTLMLLLLTAIAYLAYLSGETIRLVRRILNPVDYIKSKLPGKSRIPHEELTALPVTADPVGTATAEERYDTDKNMHTIDFDLSESHANEVPDETDDEPSEKETETEKTKQEPEKPALDIVETAEEEVADEDSKGALEPYDPKLDLENYHYPTLELLDKRNDEEAPIYMEEQNKYKDQIIEVLQNFGVGISSIKATVGPTITLYEITPAKGVRISRIKNLEDDIALSLSALGIRIIAPIPGKGTIGIEVPNARPRMVSMESILNSRKFRESDYELPIALGKTITNEVFMVDLAKMPHLLVAGATGQGKSVGLNAIITSLLYKKHPAELKFVMVDPKKVQVRIYYPIENHYLARIADEDDEPIITDVQKVVATLKSLCCEMDNRYDLLKKARARNIKEYNTKFKNRQLNPENGHRFMPYIVVVIDEFGDLIMTAGKEIELPIARIAQLARAVGIHMIIATQRPTTNIITGTIKANFPARMAFKVSSMIDSRTILDRPGANQLIGRGDMLFLSGSEPVRVQCAFVDTPEVERIAAYIAQQQSYLGPFELPKVETEGEEGSPGAVDMTHLDPLFEEAARLIVATQQGSTSMIQRKFAIGYNRAGRLMDQLEKAGIVGAAQGSKPREVMCIEDNDLEMRLNNLR
ncbi:MAG: DNA translocase FtsK [Paraprevotella sp.]|nr:DNA translocase FtsK [Paraprevotella sp.]